VERQDRLEADRWPRIQLRDWVRRWAVRYPSNEDAVLKELAGREYMDRGDMDIVIRWKFSADRRWLPGIQRRLDQEPDGWIEELTRRAFASTDDLAALLILDVLAGVGPAVASSVLMANDPDRYTVMDRKALSSLRAWKLLGLASKEATAREWLDYLHACRRLRDITGESLRMVDRALYQADGNTVCPRVLSPPPPRRPSSLCLRGGR